MKSRPLVPTVMGIRPAPLKGEIAVNIHLPSIEDAASKAEASAEPQDLSRDYAQDFVVDADYIRSLPDLQNGPTSLIRGAQKFIQHVGISNFRLPIRFQTRDSEPLVLETSVTGSVSLDAEKKGINMSRIMRTFYRQAEETFSFDVMARTLDNYKTDLESFDARLQMRLSFPMQVQSLRSGLSGFQYYNIALEVVERAEQRQDYTFGLCLFVHMPVLVGIVGTCATPARAVGHTAFAAVRGTDLGCLGRGAAAPLV